MCCPGFSCGLPVSFPSQNRKESGYISFLLETHECIKTIKEGGTARWNNRGLELTDVKNLGFFKLLESRRLEPLSALHSNIDL